MKSFSIIACWLTLSLGIPMQSSWEKFTEKADSLALKRQFEESLSYRAKALEAASSQPKSIQQKLQALQALTEAEHDFAKNRKPNADAFLTMQQAVESLQKYEADPMRISRAYRTLSETAFDYMYKAEEAEKHLQKAFDYYDKSTAKDTIYLVELMQFSGYISILSPQKRFEKAIEISERALAILAELEERGQTDNDMKAKLYYNLSLVHGMQFLNIPQKEYQYILETEKTLSSMEQPDIEPLVLMYRRLAAFEKDYGNYDKAKGYMSKAWSVYDQHKENLKARIGHKLELALLRLEVAIHMDCGDERQILQTLAKTEQLVNTHELDEVERGNYKGILNFIAAYYLDVASNLKEAKRYNDKALAIHIDSRKAPYSIDSFNQTTRIYQIKLLVAQKRYQQAMTLIQSAEKATGHFADRLLVQLKAQCLIELGNTDAAVDVINQLLTIISSDNQDFHFATSPTENFVPGYIIGDASGLIRLAESFRNHYRKHSAEEEKLYWMAMSQMQNNMENTPLNKSLKDIFDRITLGIISAALEREFAPSESNRLLTFMETLTSHGLIQNFLLKREIAGNTQLYKLVEEEQFLRAYITFLKKELQKEDSEDAKNQLFETEIKLQKLVGQLATQYRLSNPFVLPQIDVAAENKKNIIKFIVAGGELFKLRLHQGKLTYHKIENYPALKLDIEDYLRTINNLQSQVSDIKTKAVALYNKLFTDDFETTLPTVIIPDDILHYLPFELLVKDNTYLLENHTISYASSFHLLNTDRWISNISRNKKAVFFAPEYSGKLQESELALRGHAYSLAGAAEEVNQLASMIFSRKYIGDQASKRNFKSLDSDISILHLAMHSNLHDEDPELSNLMFANIEQDYEMYISELYGMHFNADLAVLSACNTGVGGFKDGGNLVSMHQAFTVAGIPATIASLWHAPDQSTKEIMLSFYKHLKQGDDKAIALRQAKLEYLRNNKDDENLQHPFYWAGFVLSGDDSPIQLANPPFWTTYWPIFAGLICALLIAIFVFSRSKKHADKAAALH